MMMSVEGGGLQPYRRLLSIEDEIEMLGILRLNAIQQIMGLDEDDLQADALRTLKVKLKETGLTEYPETQEEIDEIFRRIP